MLAFFVAAGLRAVAVARRERSDWLVWLLACARGRDRRRQPAVSHLRQSLVDAGRRRSDHDFHLSDILASPCARFSSLSWPSTALGLLGLARRQILAVSWTAPPGLLNGSIGYLPALVAAICVALGAAGAASSSVLPSRCRRRDVRIVVGLPDCRSDGVPRDSDRHAFRLACVERDWCLALYLEAAARFGVERSSQKELTPEDKPSGVQS